MTRKLIALILTVCLLMTSTNCIFAVESSSASQKVEDKLINSETEIEDLTNIADLSENMKENIKTEINVLEENGLSGFDLTEINIANNEVFYTLEFEDVIDVVSVKLLPNGNTQLHFIEGSKEDTLIKTPNGELYLNGNEVTFSENNQNVSMAAIGSSIISPCAGFTFSTTDTCPYGSASDYTYYAGANNVADISTGEMVKKITVGVLVTIMFTAMKSANIAVGVLIEKVLLSVAKKIIAYAVSNSISSKNISFKSKTYFHKTTQSYAINNTLKVKKNVTQWFVNKNYQGNVTTKITYDYGVWG